MKNEKGFSLIELIIVIAIMSVLGGFIFYSSSLLIGQDARQCANNLSTVLDKEKNYAMTKSGETDCQVELEQKTDGIYATYYVPKSATALPTDPGALVKAEEKKIGKKNVDITCRLVLEDGTTRDISVAGRGGSNRLTIVYDRVTGAVKKVNGEEHCKEVKLTVQRGRTYELTLFAATGKHELERIA